MTSCLRNHKVFNKQGRVFKGKTQSRCVWGINYRTYSQILRDIDDIAGKEKTQFAGSAGILACYAAKREIFAESAFKIEQRLYAAKRDVARRDACAPGEQRTQ